MLRSITSALTACALAGPVSVLAQNTPPAQSEKQQTPKETLTGCVLEAKTTDGGTTYVLNNVEGGSASMYVLTGSSQSEFATNVNKNHGAGAAARCAASRRECRGQSEGGAPAAFVQVESMKVVADPAPGGPSPFIRAVPS